MTDAEVISAGRAEVRRLAFAEPARLRFAFPIDDLVRDTAAQLPSRGATLMLWRPFWEDLEAGNLVIAHVSDQRDGRADLVAVLTRDLGLRQLATGRLYASGELVESRP